MPIKEISTYIRKDFHYIGSDDDEYSIVYLDTTERKYIEIRKIDKEGESDKVTFDLAMLCDIVDRLRPTTPKISKTNLKEPEVVDKRPLAVKDIQSTVDDSMSRHDGTVSPGESLVKDFHEYRTGISAGGQGELKDTPEQLKGDKEQWQKDVAVRKSQKNADPKEKGSMGKGFQRGGISPEELI